MNEETEKLIVIMLQKDLLWAFNKSGRTYKIIGSLIDKSDSDTIKILYTDITGENNYCRTVNNFFSNFTPIPLD